MADSLEEIEDRLAEAIDITDDERARDRLESAREDLRDLRERGDVDGDRADDIETEIDQHLQAIGERDSYEVERMGAADNPEDEDAA